MFTQQAYMVLIFLGWEQITLTTAEDLFTGFILGIVMIPISIIISIYVWYKLFKMYRNDELKSTISSIGINSRPQASFLITWVILSIVYLSVVISAIEGESPVWSALFGSIVTIFGILLYNNSQNDVTKERYLGRTVLVSFFATLPGILFALIYSGLGRFFALARLNWGRRGTPGGRFGQTGGLLSSLPFSLVFEDTLTREVSATTEAFTLLFFDYFVILIVLESTVLFIIGGGIGYILFYFSIISHKNLQTR